MHNVTLTVEIHYSRDANIRPHRYSPQGLHQQAETKFRTDLRTLGILPPRRDNTICELPGVIKTHWKVVHNCHFHTNLSNRFKRPGPGRERIERNLHELSILTITLWEADEENENVSIPTTLAPRDTVSFPPPPLVASSWYPRPISPSPQPPESVQPIGQDTSDSCILNTSESPTSILGKRSSWCLDPSTGSPSKRIRTHDFHPGIHDLETRLEEATAAQSELEAELNWYKSRNAELEALVSDVQRECRHPFVVPLLLKAFVSVSVSTTTAILNND